MKKLLLFTTLFVTGSLLRAQSSVVVNDFTNGQLPIANNSVIELTTAGPYDHVTTEINVTNTSATTKMYKLRRFDDLLNTGANAYFCVGSGNCYQPSTYISPISVTLTPNGTPNDNLSAQSLMYLLDMEEGPATGRSHIRYQIYDENNISDMFTFTIYYNDAVSVKDHSRLFSAVSGVYPNPVVNKAHINITSSEVVSNATVSVMNSLGSVVSTKQVELALGKNTIAVDSETLSSGIYFATITSNNTKIVKKFTINK